MPVDAPEDHEVAWDAIVVGGGPAGLSAATWLARYRRRTLVVDAGEHRNRCVEHTHGYLTRDGASPGELLGAACADLDRYETVERRQVKAVAARGEIGRFEVELADGRRAVGKRLVLATGVVDATPDIEGFDEHYGATVFHCPSCDGYEAEGLEVAVIGWSEDVAGFALELLDWAETVTVVTDGRTFEGDADRRAVMGEHGVGLIEQGAVGFLGSRGDLRALRLSDGRDLSCQMAFFSIDHHPRTTLGDAFGCERDDDGYLVVDDKGETSVPGVYAAGDLTPGYQLVQVATAKGTTAGVGCALSLRRDPPLPGAPERAPDVDAILGEEPEEHGGAGPASVDGSS